MLLFNRYEYNPQTDTAGRGEFSRVYKAIDTSNQETVAIKIYKINDLSGHYHTIHNAETIRTLVHPGLCCYFDIQEIEKEDSFGEKEKLQVCITSFMNADNLVNWYNKHKDITLFKKLVLDILNGLAYLHKKQMIHGYIKPANILTNQINETFAAAITDFAMGIFVTGKSSAANASQPLISAVPYLSPEQLNARQYGMNGNISFNTDLWSLAVVIYEALTGEPLFQMATTDFSETITARIAGFALPEKVDTLPEPFAAFMKRCLVKDAGQRVQTVEEILPLFSGDNSISENILQLEEKENTEDDTRIIALPKKDTRTKADQVQQNSSDDDTQVIRPARQSPAEISAEDAPTDEDTKIIARVANDVQPVSHPATKDEDEDNTRVIARPADVQTTNNTPVAEDTGGEDTKIISKPASIPPVENPVVKDNDAASVAAGMIDPQPNERREDESDDPVDQTIIIAKLNKEKQAGGSQAIKNNLGEAAAAASAADDTKQPDIVIRRREKPVVLFNRYEYLPATDLIGKGGFSRVYKAFDKKLSRWVALKIYKTGEFSDRYSPIAEIKRVVNLDHPNICRYLDIEEIENENPFGENEKIQVCVMELLDSGNFAEYYRVNKSPEVLKKLIQDILNGLAYLHKNGIIHRDIKPANILIKQTIEGPVAKITDFGISKNSDAENNNSSSALIVSIPYMAPEQLNAKKYGIHEKISFNLDLWSLGVTIYEVLTGKVLFKNSDQDNSEQIMANIMAPELPEKLNDLPEPFKNIVSHCVIKNARERASRAEELMVLLHSPVKIDDTPAALASEAANISSTIEKESIILEKTGQAKPSTAPPVFPPEDKISKSRFAIADEEEKPLPPKEKRKKNPLAIFIGSAVVVFILFIIYLKACNPLPPVINTNVTKRTDTVKRTITGILPADTAKTDTTAAEKMVDTVAKKTDRPVHINEKKKEKPVEESHRKEPAPTEKAGSNTASKYVLILSTEQACTLKINSVDYGELLPGKPLRVYLTTGKYMLQVISSSNSASVYSANIEVKENLLGHADKFKIPLK